MSKRASLPKKPAANPMWGGQFGAAAADAMAAINVSIHFDKLLATQDIAGSLAHCGMLEKQKIITAKESRAIQKGLKTIAQEIASGKFIFKESLEDIHMNIEARLAELIGEAAGKLHTARSRNDQVATDFKLWVRDSFEALDASLEQLQKALLTRAEEYADAVMPGFTHLQPAQPVTLGHHLLAYVEMLGRDRSRVRDARARMNESPLGAAALAGTSFPIDRAFTAKALGFSNPMANSLDAVSDRDFALEFLSIASIIAVHLSRLAEEFVLWATPMFGFITFSDRFSTGSSIMPQKRNPDGAELVRGKAGRIMGNLNALLITLKALPLAYNKDMQEDKEPVFEAALQLGLVIAASHGMVGDFTADKKRMEELAGSGYATATDLADWLVRALGIPFRKAHHITARIVKLAASQHKELHALALKDMQSVEPRIHKEVFSVLQVRDSVNSRTSFGGTSPRRVKEAIKAAKKKYL